MVIPHDVLEVSNKETESGCRRGMIGAALKVRTIEPGCLRTRAGSSYERTLLGRSSGPPGEAWSSCEWSRRPNLLTTTTTLMVSLMGAAAVSAGDQGAYSHDQKQQVLSSGRLERSYMEAATALPLQPFMGASQGGCRGRRRPCGMRKTEDQLGLEP